MEIELVIDLPNADVVRIESLSEDAPWSAARASARRPFRWGRR